MSSPRVLRFALPRFACALAVCLLFASADTAFAQRGGGPRGGAGRGGGPKQPPRTPTGTKQPPSTIGNEPGNVPGQISKFEPVTSDTDEDLIGWLTIRPSEKGAKSLKLQVRRTDNLAIVLNKRGGQHKFEPDVCADVLWKGLFCTADWDWLRKEGDSEKKKPTIRELKTLSLDTLAVEGKIEEVEGEYVTLKVRPSGNREWPDMENKETTGPTPKPGSVDTSKPKTVVEKKLRLKIFDDITTYIDADQKALDMGDFAVDQQIKAIVVYGKKDGFLVELQSLTSEEKKEGETTTKKPADPQKPTGPIGPRGGGGRIRLR